MTFTATRKVEITVPLTHPLQGVSRSKAQRKKSDGRCEYLCAYLADKVGDLDGDELDNRRACWSLILRVEKKDPDADAVEVIQTLIDVATDPANWHAKNVTNFRYLLNHARQIANAHRERFAKGTAVAARGKVEELARRFTAQS